MSETQERARLMAAAEQLRRVVDSAVEQEASRAGLPEQAKRAMAGVGLVAWRAFLDELKPGRAGREGPGDAASPPNVDDMDPQVLADRLAVLTPFVSDDVRKRIIEKLSGAGLIQSQPGQAAETAGGEDGARIDSPQLRQKLGLGPTDGIDGARAAELLGIYHEFMCITEQLIWTTWRTIATTTSVKPAALLKKTAGRFLGGNGQVSPEQISADVQHLRRVTGALIAAVGQVAQSLTHERLEQLSPTAIADLVKREGVGFLKNVGARCWEKYVELYRDFDKESLERDIMSGIAEFAEQMIQRAPREAAGSGAGAGQAAEKR